MSGSTSSPLLPYTQHVRGSPHVAFTELNEELQYTIQAGDASPTICSSTHHAWQAIAELAGSISLLCIADSAAGIWQPVVADDLEGRCPAEATAALRAMHAVQVCELSSQEHGVASSDQPTLSTSAAATVAATAGALRCTESALPYVAAVAQARPSKRIWRARVQDSPPGAFSDAGCDEPRHPAASQPALLGMSWCQPAERWPSAAAVVAGAVPLDSVMDVAMALQRAAAPSQLCSIEGAAWSLAPDRAYLVLDLQQSAGFIAWLLTTRPTMQGVLGWDADLLPLPLPSAVQTACTPREPGAGPGQLSAVQWDRLLRWLLFEASMPTAHGWQMCAPDVAVHAQRRWLRARASLLGLDCHLLQAEPAGPAEHARGPDDFPHGEENHSRCSSPGRTPAASVSDARSSVTSSKPELAHAAAAVHRAAWPAAQARLSQMHQFMSRTGKVRRAAGAPAMSAPRGSRATAGKLRSSWLTSDPVLLQAPSAPVTPMDAVEAMSAAGRRPRGLPSLDWTQRSLHSLATWQAPSLSGRRTVPAAGPAGMHGFQPFHPGVGGQSVASWPGLGYESVLGRNPKASAKRPPRAPAVPDRHRASSVHSLHSAAGASVTGTARYSMSHDETSRITTDSLAISHISSVEPGAGQSAGPAGHSLAALDDQSHSPIDSALLSTLWTALQRAPAALQAKVAGVEAQYLRWLACGPAGTALGAVPLDTPAAHAIASMAITASSNLEAFRAEQ